MRLATGKSGLRTYEIQEGLHTEHYNAARRNQSRQKLF